MTVALPPQDLECLDPENCPVATRTVARKVQNGSIPRVTVDSTRMWFRVYDAQDGHSQPNPGFGDTRFAPFDAETSGHRVPTMYLAESMIGALLETSLHDVHAKTPRIVRERDLFGKLHARVESCTLGLSHPETSSWLTFEIHSSPLSTYADRMSPAVPRSIIRVPARLPAHFIHWDVTVSSGILVRRS